MSNWKQQQREQRYQRWQEEQSRKEAAEKRAQQNAILKAAGYQWKKVVIGDGGDANSWDFEWILFNIAGEIVSVSQALKEIEAKEAAKPHLCYNCSDKYVPQSMHHCTDEKCQCSCRKPPEPTGHALVTPEPERHEETNAQPEPEQETLEAESSASSPATPKDELLALFGIEHPELCYRCQNAAKERGEYCASCAAITDAEIAEREAEQRAEDEAAGAAFIEARQAGKSLNEQYAAYAQAKKQRGGARPGAGRRPDSAKAHTREPLYQEGYNAGYQAGLRAVKR